MPSTISRRVWTAGRPPAFASGTCGARSSHSPSLRSVGYGRRAIVLSYSSHLSPQDPYLFRHPLGISPGGRGAAPAGDDLVDRLVADSARVVFKLQAPASLLPPEDLKDLLTPRVDLRACFHD